MAFRLGSGSGRNTVTSMKAAMPLGDFEMDLEESEVISEDE